MDFSTYSVTLGGTDYPAKYASLLAALQQNLQLIYGGANYVGIGTAAPTYRLHIYDPSNPTQAVCESAGSSDAILRFRNGANGALGGIVGLGGGGLSLEAGGSSRVVVATGGSVGIGTASPQQNLHVSSTGSSVIFASTTSTSDALARFKTLSGEWGVGVGIGTSANCLNFYNFATGLEAARLENGGAFILGGTALIPGVSSSCRFHAYGGNGEWSAALSNSGATPYGLKIRYSGVTGGTGQIFIDASDDATRFRVLGSGNVQNANNSYGAVSDVRLKENVVDATPKLASLLGVRIVNYNLIGNPTKQLGVVAQELEQVFPGLVEETEEFEEVVVQPARIEVRKVMRQKVARATVAGSELQQIGGRWVRVPTAVEIDEPMFVDEPVFNQDGSPCMVTVEDEQPVSVDEGGNAIPGTPAVRRQMTHRVPVMEEVEERVEVPAVTERRASGRVVKSVKYSVFVPMLIKAVQELAAKVDAQAARLSELEART